VTLHTHFAGGVDGDNWNIERVQLLATVPPATFMSFSPTFAAREGGDQITIAGTSFDTKGGTQILFGGVTATNVVCADSTHCTATIPAGDGASDVTVKVRGATVAASSGVPFRFVPSVLSVLPQSAHAGDTVTLSGIGLVAGTSIAFGANPAANAVCASDSCQVTVPAGGGVVNVIATVAGHTSAASSANAFSYVSPTITSLDTTKSGIGGGEVMAIHGAGFDPCPNSVHGDKSTSMAVYFGGTQAPTVWCSDSQQLAVIIPAVTAAGQVDVTVVSYGQTTAIVPSDRFTYTQYPALRSFFTGDSPPPGSINLTLTLDSRAPAGGALVTLGGVTAPATALIPAGSDDFTFPMSLSRFTGPLTASYAGTTLTAFSNATPTVCVEPKKACRKGTYWDAQECACMGGIN
jgi:hypothetical protein